MRGLDRLTYARLTAILVERKGVSADAAAAALAEADRLGVPYPEALVRQEVVTEDTLATLVAEEFGLPILSLHACHPDRDVLGDLPADFRLRHLLVPLDRFAGTLTVLMPALTPGPVLHQVKERTGLAVFPVVGYPIENRRFLEGLARAAGASPDAESRDGDGRAPGTDRSRSHGPPERRS